jgi:hypothetical protein
VPLKGTGAPNQPVIRRLVMGGGRGGRRQATQSHPYTFLKVFLIKGPKNDNYRLPAGKGNAEEKTTFSTGSLLMLAIILHVDLIRTA